MSWKQISHPNNAIKGEIASSAFLNLDSHVICLTTFPSKPLRQVTEATAHLSPSIINLPRLFHINARAHTPEQNA